MVAAVASGPRILAYKDGAVWPGEPEWRRAHPPDPSIVTRPPIFIAFDLLYRAGKNLTDRPLQERRARLEDLVAGAEVVHAVRRLATDGLAAWQQVLDGDYEGYVAKDEASVYVGGPTRAWLRVKPAGWTRPER